MNNLNSLITTDETIEWLDEPLETSEEPQWMAGLLVQESTDDITWWQ
jgi:hypothetical protein